MTKLLCRSRAPLLLVLLATSCGALVDPFEGVPPVFPPPGVSVDDLRVSVCYNSHFSTPEQVRAIAVTACGAQGEPQLIDQDTKLYCPILTPARANFVCTAQ